MKKFELIRARLPSDAKEVQANAHNKQRLETMDDQAMTELDIDPLIVQFPHDETKQLGIVDYSSALGYILSVLELPSELSRCSDGQILMKSYYLPALALFMQIMRLLALTSKYMPLRSNSRFPKIGCVIFHIAEDSSVKTRCLRGFSDSSMTVKCGIGKRNKIPICGISLGVDAGSDRQDTPLMEAQNLAKVLNSLENETRFAESNKRSEEFSSLIQGLIKLPYLVPQDEAFSIRRLAVHFRLDTQNFLNNFLRFKYFLINLLRPILCMSSRSRNTN